MAWLLSGRGKAEPRHESGPGEALAILIGGQRLRRRVHARQHLVPGGKQKQPEGGAHLVPERAAGTEEGADALIQAIHQFEDLVHEEREQVEGEERL